MYHINMVFINCEYLHFIFNDALCAGTTPCKADIVSVKPPLASW